MSIVYKESLKRKVYQEINAKLKSLVKEGVIVDVDNKKLN